MWRKSLLSLLLLWVAFPAAAEQLPIWLNEDFFGIARIEDFERRLHQPFPAAADLSLPARHGRPSRPIGSCAEYVPLHLEEEVWAGELRSPLYSGYFLLETCEILAYLKWARPAERSFVREELFEGPLPGLLPAEFKSTANCEPSGLWRDPGRPWPLSWGHLHDPQYHNRHLRKDDGTYLAVHSVGADRAVITILRTYDKYLTVLAHADFDGDGLEDVLMLLESWDRWAEPRLWLRNYGAPTATAILTRNEPGGRFRILYSAVGAYCHRVDVEKWKIEAAPAERRLAKWMFPALDTLESLGQPLR